MKEIVTMKKIHNCLGILEKNIAVNGPPKSPNFVSNLFTETEFL